MIAPAGASAPRARPAPLQSAPASPPSAEDLARRAQAGSAAAFGALVEMFEGRLHSFLLRRTGREHDAEDIVQETFVRAWERIERYDDRWRFSTWLFTIGSRLAAGHGRRARHDPAAPRAGATDPAALAVVPDDPADLQAERNLGRRLWDAAARTLSSDQHAALWLRYAEGLAVADIAHVLGKSPVGVRVILFRARERLARDAEESGLAAQVRRAGGAP